MCEGSQVDTRPLSVSGDSPDDDAVAAYVAKYVTKGASETGAGTLLYTTGAGSIWPDPRVANVNAAAAALRNWAMNLH
ncbi:replication initiator, partial [Streptomyces sp. SP17KL33]|uniref:replication initiator n=1 Tax=Streptomyces sp. SP17KL33 TaxID=3002534 RepID=UPI002E79F1C2